MGGIPLSPLSLRAKYKQYFSTGRHSAIQSSSVLKIFVFLHSILSSRTVCLYKCRDKIAGKSKKEAKYVWCDISPTDTSI